MSIAALSSLSTVFCKLSTFISIGPHGISGCGWTWFEIVEEDFSSFPSVSFSPVSLFNVVARFSVVDVVVLSNFSSDLDDVISSRSASFVDNDVIVSGEGKGKK